MARGDGPDLGPRWKTVVVGGDPDQLSKLSNIDSDLLKVLFRLVDLAHWGAFQLGQSLNGRRMIVLGQRAAQVLGVDGELMNWRYSAHRDVAVLQLPHPSASKGWTEVRRHDAQMLLREEATDITQRILTAVRPGRIILGGVED